MDKTAKSISTVRIVLDVEPHLRQAFKARCALEGSTMTDVLKAFVIAKAKRPA